jgi:subtilisin family serine protease
MIQLMPENKFKIMSNEYIDLLIRYNDIASLEPYEKYSVHIMNPSYAVIYLPISQAPSSLIIEYGYSSVPKCYALTSRESLKASGIISLRRIPALNLRGKGVLVGIIDTGIDYTNPVFQYEDGTTKIAAIWDQNIDSVDQYPNLTYPAYYGTEYSSEQINKALISSDPLQIVPSFDENGHGTMLAGIAAGSENAGNNFSGVAPDAELLIVKLKPAKKNLTDFYLIPPNVPCYQENDIIWALQYLLNTADKLNRPLTICIGLGTSQGSHDNQGFLNTSISLSADFPGRVISIAAGNEGMVRRHFYSTLVPTADPIPVELNVGSNNSNFTMEFWGNPPMIYKLNIISPSGESVPMITESLKGTRTIRFIFEPTIINVDYILIERDTGKQLIMLRFINPSQGVWLFQIAGRGDINGSFHIWLPSAYFISDDTYFLNYNIYTTLTSPSNVIEPITVTAYNPVTGTLYPNSGRGFSTSNILNPDLAAPGVNIQCPALDNDFTFITGTGAATAHMAGIAAMILEWAIVNNNYPGIDTIGIKKFLLRGAKRSLTLQYPNQDWGYGIVDVFNTFDIFRTSF